MTFKEKIYRQYLIIANQKIDELKKVLADLKETGSNETKSTAGDKHETALAMIQIEQENKNKQLEAALLQKQLLERINPVIKATKVGNGSLVKTNKSCLFFIVALGKIVVDEISIISLSIQSPLGQKLVGLNVHDTAELNGIAYTIESIE